LVARSIVGKMEKTEKIAGFAHFPIVDSTINRPSSVAAILAIFREQNDFLPRGNARSYGDASLAKRVISTQKWRKFIDFDEKTGLFTCQSGVLFHEIMDWSMPRGWFFQVTPGTKMLSVGGAIAADVHGKNHETDGNFSRWLHSFRLMTRTGEVKNCSRDENFELFWQTIGGFGSTGLILDASFFLRKIKSPFLNQETLKTNTFDELFDHFETSKNWKYRAAWIDCFSENFRGILFRADHFSPTETFDFSKIKKEKAGLKIPFMLPFSILNSLTIKLFNQFYWLKNKTGAAQISFNNYFYPLDSVQNWNRLYGKNGFIQYQFVLPELTAKQGIYEALKLVKSSNHAPFLVVLKKFGAVEIEAKNSFPMRGFTLALDFARKAGIEKLVEQLDDLLFPLGGKIYLAKDAMSHPKMSGFSADFLSKNDFRSQLFDRLFPTNDEK
jgi:decaprenylphospho-beta-D-ribofuranose 2-oxidase